MDFLVQNLAFDKHPSLKIGFERFVFISNNSSPSFQSYSCHTQNILYNGRELNWHIIWWVKIGLRYHNSIWPMPLWREYNPPGGISINGKSFISSLLSFVQSSKDSICLFKIVKWAPICECPLIRLAESGNPWTAPVNSHFLKSINQV